MCVKGNVVDLMSARDHRLMDQANDPQTQAAAKLLLAGTEAKKAPSIPSKGDSFGGLHSRTQYSNATPSGSFSANHASAASAFAKTLR